MNRSAHFVGDRLIAPNPGIEGNDFTVSLWFWSGTAPGKIRTWEWLFSRDVEEGPSSSGIHVGLHDASPENRYLVYHIGGSGIHPLNVGKIERWTWNHLVIARSENSFHLLLNGKQIAVNSGQEILGRKTTLSSLAVQVSGKPLSKVGSMKSLFSTAHFRASKSISSIRTASFPPDSTLLGQTPNPVG